MALRCAGSPNYANRTSGGWPSLTDLSFCCWARVVTNSSATQGVFAYSKSGWPFNEFSLMTNSVGTEWVAYSCYGSSPDEKITSLGACTDGLWTFLGISKDSSGNLNYAIRTASASTATTGTDTGHTSCSSFDVAYMLREVWGGYLNGNLAAVKVWSGVKLTTDELARESYQILPVRWADLFEFVPLLGNLVQGIDTGKNYTASGTATWEHGPPVPWTAVQPRRIYIPGAGGGTTYYQTCTGALTPAGALVRQVNKGLAGGVTPAGLVAKALSRSFSGGGASTGALLKKTSRTLTGAATSAGSLASTKTKLASLAGAAGSSGALVKQTTKTLAGTASSSGLLLKTLARTLAGTAASAGSVTSLKTKLASLAGTVSSAGALVRQTAKSLGGTVASTGSLRKALSRTLAGVVTSAGALASLKTKLASVSGTISSSGALTKRVARTLAGGAASAGSLVKALTRTFSGTVTSSGTVARLKTKLASMAGTLASSGTLVRSVGKTLTGTVSSAGSVVKSLARTLAGAIVSHGAVVVYKVGTLILDLATSYRTDGYSSSSGARSVDSTRGAGGRVDGYTSGTVDRRA